MRKKQLAIGASDFKEICENYYYVDKSLLIQELLDAGSKISLITRPRRFGKTTNLSMLKYWFEHTDNQDSSKIFQNLAIWQQGEDYTKHCGSYPVISLTFKDIKETSWESCQEKIKFLLSDEYNRHNYLLDSESISAANKETFAELASRKGNMSLLENSLKILIDLLHTHFHKKVVILIDEYDTPIIEAYDKGFYQEAIGFFRSLLGTGLKDNSSLFKGVLTGILRIGKESVFSDLNNFDVYTTLSHRYADKFGLLQAEVSQALQYYDLEARAEDVKNWYNGYVFGKVHDIYNPWSILTFIHKHEEGLLPHWINTSSNLLIKELLSQADIEAKQDMEDLVAGKAIYKEIIPDTVFSDLTRSSDSLWSFFLFCGYLKVVRQNLTENGILFCELAIPNREVAFIYKRFLNSWFSDHLLSTEVKLLLQCLLNGEVHPFGEILSKFVANSMSYFDPSGEDAEKVYHAFVLGLLLQLSDSYQVKSNRESGYGRYDIMLIPKSNNDAGVIIEFKKVSYYRKETLEIAANLALEQIQDKQYESELQSLGIGTIHKYGIAFDKKDVLVKLG
ncbi:MAG: AAA family ATPase [Spirochaetota bacterium]